jgi:protein-S-isoprenylcysteine O-methyltransferase
MGIEKAIRDRFVGVQAVLNFEHWTSFPAFSHRRAVGRVALIASLLGLFWGWHLLWGLQLCLHLYGRWWIRIETTNTTSFLNSLEHWIGFARLQMWFQWCVYSVALCSFHLLEFFVTAIYNPTEATADSFLINHSSAYSAALIISWIEFGVRFLFFPRFNSRPLSFLGIALVVISQGIRSVAMATAGESFNHLIQNFKKDTHVLVTHGIYNIFRHPSYVGFFYWSVGTQMVLSNPFCCMAYAITSWTFFRRRIEYEEESLEKFFPDQYPIYAARTYMGIPFLKSHINTSSASASVRKS